MGRATVQETQLTTEIYARAGLIATEFSLLGLGAGSTIVTLLLALLPEHGGLVLLRPGLAASAGLLGCGTAISVVGRALDLGGSRTHKSLYALWKPLLLLAVLGASLCWFSLHRVGQLADTTEKWTWPNSLLAVFVLLGMVAIVLLATLALRALTAVQAGAPMAIAQMWQAHTHTLTGALGLVTLIGYSTENLTRELQVFLATALCVMAGHAVLATLWLLRGSHRTLKGLRQAGLRVHLLERGHGMATLALLGGLIAPGLLVLANLLIDKDISPVLACALFAISNHAMRYAWVLLPLQAPVPTVT